MPFAQIAVSMNTAKIGAEFCLEFRDTYAFCRMGCCTNSWKNWEIRTIWLAIRLRLSD
jgi:hypothetical protein